jgi:hypothetical protein
MVADVLLNGTALEVAAEDRVAQMVVAELGLEAAAGALLDPPAEQVDDSVRAAAGAVAVEEALAQAVQGGALLAAQVGAVLHLTADQPVAEPLAAALGGGEDRDPLSQPAVGAGHDLLGGERVRQRVQVGRGGAGEEGVAVLLEGGCPPGAAGRPAPRGR